MKHVHIVLGVALAGALAGCQPKESAANKQADEAAAVTASSETAAVVEPEAVDALKRMSAYLGTLTNFEVKSDTSVELVMDDDQKTEVNATVRYLVHRPDSFVIDVVGDRKARQFFYDGKSLTINAPKLGYYASVPAPPTIRETLAVAEEKHGIQLPLEDLFTWSDPASARTEDLQSAWLVGPSMIDGQQTDQYAFREEGVDWQIWIARGDKPLPRKLVITDRIDPAHPQFEARLAWNTAPSISKSAFAFTPPSGSKSIRMASAE